MGQEEGAAQQPSVDGGQHAATVGLPLFEGARHLQPGELFNVGFGLGQPGGRGGGKGRGDVELERLRRLPGRRGPRASTRPLRRPPGSGWLRSRPARPSEPVPPQPQHPRPPMVTGSGRRTYEYESQGRPSQGVHPGPSSGLQGFEGAASRHDCRPAGRGAVTTGRRSGSNARPCSQRPSSRTAGWCWWPPTGR
jgi:hypothetical protein